jgi:hypothetical protein
MRLAVDYGAAGVVVESASSNRPRRSSPPTRTPRMARAAPSETAKESVNTATPNI